MWWSPRNGLFLLSYFKRIKRLNYTFEDVESISHVIKHLVTKFNRGVSKEACSLIVFHSQLQYHSICTIFLASEIELLLWICWLWFGTYCTCSCIYLSVYINTFGFKLLDITPWTIFRTLTIQGDSRFWFQSLTTDNNFLVLQLIIIFSWQEIVFGLFSIFIVMWKCKSGAFWRVINFIIYFCCLSTRV